MVKIKKLLPPLLLALGAFSIFISNLIFAKILDRNSYSAYAIFMSYAGIVLSFGMIGLDQVILRVARINDGLVFLPRSLRNLVMCVIFIAGLLFSILFFFGYANAFDFIYVFLFTIAATISIFLYNFYRLVSNNLVAQLIINSWKITFGVLSFVALIFHVSFDVEVLIGVAVLVNAISLVFFFYNDKWRANFIDGDISWIKLWPAYLFSMFILTGMGFSDRFIIDHLYGSDSVAEYFFTASIILQPFLILAAYIGFKELVKFKGGFTIDELNKQVVRAGLFGGSLGIAILLGLYIIEKSQIFEKVMPLFRWEFGVPLIAIGVIRLIYSLLSSAMGAVGTAKYIYAANAISLLSLIFLIFIVNSYLFPIATVAWFYAIIWVVRAFAYYFGIISDCREKTSHAS